MALTIFDRTQSSKKGTTTNDNAAAGEIGEYVESVFSGVASGGSGVIIDATSISLTAGDWDVSLNLLPSQTSGTAATSTSWSAGITQTPGNSIVGLVNGSNYASSLPGFNGNSNDFRSICGYRQSLSATTTVYAKAVINFPSGTWGWYGRLSARRVR